MADANKTAAVFESLQLNYISKEWVKSCWDDDFVDLSTLPDTDRDFLEENDYFTEPLTSAQEILSLWLQANNENENGEGLWIILVESEVSHKTLVALLAFLCHNSNKIACSFSERAAGVIAASVYLKLIALPGSAAFQIYNPELFLQACRLLNKWKKSDGQSAGKRKRNETHIKASQKSKKSKRDKKRVSDEFLSHANTDDENQGSEGEDEVLELVPAEIAKLDQLMNLLLEDVLLICEKYSLRQSESTAIQLLGVLLNLAKVDPESISEKMGQWKRKCSSGILVFKAIYLLCLPFHGHVTVIVNELFKEFLEHILLLEDGKVFASINRPLLLIRQHALDFVMYLAKEMGERCVQSLKVLLQHICYKVPDRTEYRSHAAEAVIELLDCLPDLEFAQMLEWLKRLSKQKKVTQRGFAVDVILKLLEQPERKLSAEVPPELSQFTTHKSMICTVLSRCSDLNASVSSRALLGFSLCTNSKHNDIVRTIKEVITPIAEQARPMFKQFMPTPIMALAKLTDTDGTDKDPIVESVDNQSKENDTTELTKRNICTPSDKRNSKTPQGRVSVEFFGAIELTPGFNPYLPDTKGVISMFHRRILETKVIVRKCAIQALQKVIQLEAPQYRDEDLDALQDRCADPALSVRKQAVQALSELLKAFPGDKRIQKAWVFGILPQVMDRETSVQEKCFDLLEEMILMNMKLANRSSTSGIEWDLLSLITSQNSEKLRRYLQKACQYWARTKKLKTSIVNAVQSHVEGANSEFAWMFLAEISKTLVKIDHELVINHWKKIPPISYDSPCTKWTNILSVLGATAKSIPSGAISDILENLKQKLRQFSYPPSIISGMVNCVSQLHNFQEQEASQRQLQAWGEELMMDCDKYMSQVILNSDNGMEMQIDEEQLIRYMFTLGEVCQRCPTRMPKRVTLLIQSIIAAPCISDSDQEHQDSSGGPTEGSCSQQSQSDSLESDSKLTAPSSQASQPLSQFKGSKMSTRLRAHAFVTLGKLCLVDESLAKKTIAALARELEESDSPAIRNNVVIVMGDLTIRYTTLIDRYVTNMAVCLKDPSALVRKNALTTLTRLLQEEYIKWKGVLFFRYITTLLDETQEIKDLAAFCLEHLLLKKHPNMFFHPFIECIFHFNNYQTHPVYNKFTQSDKEKQKFTLAGASNESRRRQLYMFMLEHMSDEQKFKVAAKTNKEILSAVVDKIIPLDDNGSHLLRDALAILSSKEIKLSTMRGRGAEDTDETTDIAQLVTATAKKVLISHVVKRNVIENIVPAVISLKHILEKNRSPLLKDLMEYLQELMKDYKTEIKEVLAADKQLAEEIEFDLRNFERCRTEVEARSTSETNTPRSNTPTIVRQKSRSGNPVIIINPLPQEVLAVRQSIENVAEAETRSRQSSPPNPKLSSRRPSITILDATKRAMSRVDQLRQTKTDFSPVRSDRGSSSPASVKSSSSKDSRKTSLKSTSSQSSETENVSPTHKNTQLRAISTPTDALYNITFATDGNITMLPPSPIPSVASAVKGRKLRMSPNVKVQQKGKKLIIYMPHPEAEDPDPIQWNIRSPTAKRQDVTSSGDSTPSRKAHDKSQAGIRRSSRQSNREEL